MEQNCGRGKLCRIFIGEIVQILAPKSQRCYLLGKNDVCLQVDDMTTVDALVAAPYHYFTHPEYGTVMRMLDTESPFEIRSHAITAS